jgi:hypothetical protein
MPSEYQLEIDLETSPWAGDLLYAVAVTLACAHLMREEGVHLGGTIDAVTMDRIRREVEERIDGISRLSPGRHHTRISEPFDPALLLSEYTWESDPTPGAGETLDAPDREKPDRMWEITPLFGYDGSAESTAPWHRERGLTSAVGLRVDDEPRVGVIASQHSPDGAGEIIAWAEGEVLRRWIWSMYPSDSGPDGVERWLGHAYDCLRTPEFLRKEASTMHLRDIPFDFHRERVAGRAIIRGLLAAERPASVDAAIPQILAIRRVGESKLGTSPHLQARPRSWLPVPTVDPSFDPGWLQLSPLVRARAQGALLGLVCGARVAASFEPGKADPDRSRPTWQPEVDRRAEEMGLGPARATSTDLRDSIRAALVGARTIIAEGAYHPEAMLAAYRRAGIFVEATKEESNWYLPRLIPVMLFAFGVKCVLPADLNPKRYSPSVDPTDPDAPVDWSQLAPHAPAVSEFLGMPFGFVRRESELTHGISLRLAYQVSTAFWMLDEVFRSDHEDPLAGVRFHRSFKSGNGPRFSWGGDRRSGHLFRDQVAPIFNAPRDELDPKMSNPRGPDDADLPPLPRGVGLGKWGDEKGKRRGELTFGDATQPPLDEGLQEMLMMMWRTDKTELPAPDEATGDFDLAATLDIIRYHLSENLSFLSAVHETMSLGGNTIVPTAMSASILGWIHGWRAIPRTWIDAVKTAELSLLGIAGEDLVEGHIAEALIQTGYRWGSRWLHDHGVDVSKLERKAPEPKEEDGIWGM